MDFRCLAFDHRREHTHQRGIGNPVRVDHRRQPVIGKRPHALCIGEFHVFQPFDLFAFDERMNAGIEQGQTRYACWSKAPHFHRDPRPHGVPGNIQRPGISRQSILGHGRNRILGIQHRNRAR